MSTQRKKWLALTLLVMAGFASSNAYAASSVSVDIHVSINATKALTVGPTVYNYGALNVDVSSVSAQVVVTNTSTSLIETYRIQGASATSDSGGTNWALA